MVCSFSHSLMIITQEYPVSSALSQKDTGHNLSMKQKDLFSNLTGSLKSRLGNPIW